MAYTPTWVVSGTTATYYDENSKVVAKLSGIKSGLKAEDLKDVIVATDSEGVSAIELNDDLLGTSKVTLTLSNGGKYKLALASGVTKKAEITSATATISGTKLTVKGTIKEGWFQTNDKTLTYITAATAAKEQTLATVSGLKSGLYTTTEDDVTELDGVGAEGQIGVKSGEGGNASFTEAVTANNTGTITLNQEALGTSKIAVSSNYGYTLAFGSNTNGSSGVVGGTPGTEYWAVSGTTATYKQDTSAKYALAADAKSIAYTKGTTATIATIKGLAKDLNSYLDSGEISGISVGDNPSAEEGEPSNIITLSKNVLATTNNSKATLTLGKDYASDYKLAIDNDIGTEGYVPLQTDSEKATFWTISGSTAYFKEATTTYYTLNGNVVTCTADTSPKTLATISGIKSGFVAKADGIYASADDTEKIISIENGDEYKAAVEEDDPTTEKTNESADAVIGKITIKNGALNNKTVSLTSSQYVLKVDTTDIKEPEGTPTWSVNGTTATYKGNMSAGYTLDSSGKKLTYTAAKNGATLVTLTGVRKPDTNTTATAIAAAIETAESKNEETGKTTITIGADALGASDIKISGSNSPYELAFAEDLTTQTLTDESKVVFKDSTADYDKDSIEEGVAAWRLSGTTATYKKIIPDYYQIENGVIKYHKEADFTVKDANNKDQSVILATITGLKSGLTAEELFADGTGLISFDSEDPPTKIIIKKDALGTGTVELKNSAYTLAFDSSEEATIAPALKSGVTPTWSVSGTTATLKGDMDAGYTLSGNKITYTAAKSKAEMAKVSGLKSGLKDADLNGDNAVISYNDSTKEITLKEGALGATAVTLSDKAVEAGYIFALDAGVETTGTSLAGGTLPDGKDVWVDDTKSNDASGTYRFVHYTPAYYTYESKVVEEETVADQTKILYTGENYPADEANSSFAKISGLKKGLLITDKDDENYGNLGSYNAAGEFVAAVVGSSEEITVNASAFDGKNITLTDGLNSAGSAFGGKLVLGTDISDKEPEAVLTSSVTVVPANTRTNTPATTTLTIKKGTSEGYELNATEDTIIYTAADEGDTVAVITGLASGITVGTKDDKDEDGDSAEGKIGYVNDDGEFVEVLQIGELATEAGGTDDTTITILSRDALTTSPVAVTSSDYTLAFEDEDDFEVTNKDDNEELAWVQDASDKTKYYLVKYSTPGYEIETGDKSIAYTAAGFGTAADALATITGLKSNLVPDKLDGTIEGITVDESGTIKLSEDVLGTDPAKAITLEVSYDTTEEKYNEFSLDITGVAESETEGSWTTPKNGTTTYVEKTTAGWALETITNEEDPEDTEHNPQTVAAINYTAAGTVKTEISGLATAVKVLKESDVDETNILESDIGKIGIVDSTDGFFTEAISVGEDAEGNKVFVLLDKGALAAKNVVLKNQKDINYKLELSEDAAAETEEAVWNKGTNDTKATYTQKTGVGHVQTNDTTVTYLDANKAKNPQVLATLSGLKKGFAAEEGLLEGIEVTTDDETGKNIIRVDREVLGASNVTLAKTDKYDLALNGTEEEFDTLTSDLHINYDSASGKALLQEGTTEGWYYKKDNNGNITDYKTLYHTNANLQTRATISGLKKGLETDDDGNLLDDTLIDFIEATAADTANGIAAADGTIILGSGILDTMKISLGNNDKYKFAFAEDEEDAITPTDGEYFWSVDGKGKAEYWHNVSDGHVIDEKTGKSVTYEKEKSGTTRVVVATITGLSNDVTTWTDTEIKNGKEVAKDAPLTPEAFATKYGIEVGELDLDEDGKPVANSGIITITKEKFDDNGEEKNVLAAKEVKITSTLYNLEVDEALNPQAFEAPRWYYNGSTIVLKDGKDAGYENKASENNKSITYKSEDAGTTLVTISGLNKDIKRFTAKDKAWDTDTGAEVTLEDQLGYIVKNEEVVTGKNDKGEDVTAKKNVFHSVDEISFEELGYNEETGKTEYSISLPDSYLATSNIEIKNGTDYSFKFEDDAEFKPVADDPVWTGNKGSLKITQHISSGFNLNEDENKFTFQKEQAANTAIAAISGLNSKVEAYDDNGTIKAGINTGTAAEPNYTELVTFDADDKIITVKKDALEGAKKVSVSGTGKYQLALDEDVTQYAENATEWVTDKTTAVYKTYDKDYFDLDSNGAIVYYAATKGTTHLTLSGIESGATIDHTNSSIFDTTNKKIILGAGQLDSAKVTLKINSTADDYKGYKLELSTALTVNDTVNKTLGTGEKTFDYASTIVTADNWSMSGTNATLKGTQTKGYSVASDGMSITYSAADASKNLATIKGLKNGAKITGNSNIVTLTSAELGTSAVNITGDGYNVALHSSIAAPTVELKEEDPLVVKSGTATLYGKITKEGYMLGVDGKSVAYTASVASDKAFTTIKGVKVEELPKSVVDTATRTITLTNSQLNDSVTLGGGLFSFNFEADYKDANIVGSSTSDSIKVLGSGVSVNAGNGDDFVDFDSESKGGNTFIYANGNGNDVIANFDTAKDKINLTNVSVTADNFSIGDGDGDGNKNDIIIKVGNGSITLKDLGSQSDDFTTTLNNKGTEETFSFNIESGTLREIVSASGNGYLASDADFSMTPTSLVKQSAISYSGSTKK